jgi:hypothetical protein
LYVAGCRDLAEPQLRSLANSEIISERRDQALNELAVLGDFDAQHTLLERIRAALEENPHSFERDGPHWLGVVTSADLAELLGSILRAAHGASETSLLSRQVEAAIRNIADPRCIAVYDELIEPPTCARPSSSGISARRWSATWCGFKSSRGSRNWARRPSTHCSSAPQMSDGGWPRRDESSGSGVAIRLPLRDPFSRRKSCSKYPVIATIERGSKLQETARN